MKAFVIDIDGVMTDGRMWYTAGGKWMKAFGPDDHEALKMICDKIEILFTSGDHRGFAISERRVWDMGFDILFTSMGERAKVIEERWGLENTIYMGDGLLDVELLGQVGYAICPADAFYLAKEKADYVTRHNGGHRAVAEACMHIQSKFLV